MRFHLCVTIWSLALAVVGAVFASGQDCVDYRDFQPYESKLLSAEPTDWYGSSSSFVYLGALKYRDPDYYSEIYPVDCRDPLHPVSVDTLEFGDLYRFVVKGSYALASIYEYHFFLPPFFSLYSVDVDGSLDFVGRDYPNDDAWWRWATDFAISDDVVFVLMQRGGLGGRVVWTYRMRQEGGLELLHTFGASLYAYGIESYGYRIFLSSSYENIQWIDCDQNGAFIERGPLDFSNIPGTMAIQDGRMYLVTTDRELRVLDITDPDHYRTLGSLSLGGQPSSLAVAGDSLLVGDLSMGLQVIDASDFSNMRVVKQMALPGGTPNVDVVGRYAAVPLSQATGLGIVDPQQDYAPDPLVGESSIPAIALDAAGSKLVSFSSPNLYLVNVRDGLPQAAADTFSLEPYVPNIQSLSFMAVGNNVAVVGGWGPLQGDVGTLMVTPPSPTGKRDVVDLNDFGGLTAVGAIVDVDFVYLTEELDSTTNMLSIVDISDPWHPFKESELPVVGGNWKMSRKVGKYFLALIGGDHLVVVDVSDPGTPFVVAEHLVPLTDPYHYAQRFVVGDGWIMVSCDFGDMITMGFDGPDIVTYSCAQGTHEPHFFDEMEYLDGILYAKGSVSGAISVYDASDPCDLVYLNDCPGMQDTFEILDNRIYAGTSRGMFAWETQCPVSGIGMASGRNPFRESRNSPSREAGTPGANLSPNPFNPSTEVRFSLPDSRRVEVSVYDLQGRRVALLADRVFGAGDHHVTWNGRNEAGRAAASGLYMIRVDTGEEVRTLKALLLK